jgi:collagen type III alpha
MPAGGEQDSAAGERPGDDRSMGEPKPGSGENTGDGAAGSDPGGTGESAAADMRPPDPVDLDYAKRATDLVLDYLNQNRDAPDPELLDRLNWTPEELQEFSQRWNRQLQQPGSDAAAADPRQVEEALKSLGIRPPGEGPIGASREQADDLRGLRDAGGRRPAPNLHRDAFEAFRQGLRRP